MHLVLKKTILREERRESADATGQYRAKTTRLLRPGEADKRDSRLSKHPRLRRFQLRIQVRKRAMTGVVASSLDALLLLPSRVGLLLVLRFRRRWSDRAVDQMPRRDLLDEREEPKGWRKRRLMVLVGRRRKGEGEGIRPGRELLQAGVEVRPLEKLVVACFLDVGFEPDEDPFEGAWPLKRVFEVLGGEVGPDIQPEGFKLRKLSDDVVHDVGVAFPAERKTEDKQRSAKGTKVEVARLGLSSRCELRSERTDQLRISNDFTRLPRSSPSGSRKRRHRGVSLGAKEGEVEGQLEYFLPCSSPQTIDG